MTYTRPITAATISIAASNSLYPERADYKCTGTNDQNTINPLIAAYNDIYFMPGTYTCSGDINVCPDLTLRGGGMYNTIFNFTNGAARSFYNDGDISNLCISDIKLIGYGTIYFKGGGDHILLKNIINTSSQNRTYGAFMFRANNNNFDYIDIINCEAQNIGTTGFYFQGMVSDSEWFNEVNLINCHAIQCGYGGTDWASGFNLSQNVNVSNMSILGCSAQDCWEVGFYMEVINTHKNIRFVDCLSKGNGHRKPSSTFGTGFLVNGEVVMSGCRAEDNRGWGLHIDDNNQYNTIAISGFSSTNNERGGITLINVGNVKLSFISKNDQQGLNIQEKAYNIDVDAKIITPTDQAFLHYTAIPGINCIEDSTLNLKIKDPVGTVNYAATLSDIKNSNLNIEYKNINPTTYGLLFRRLFDTHINISAVVDVGDVAMLFATQNQNVVLSGNIENGTTNVHMNTAGDKLLIKDYTINNATTGFNFTDVLEGVILDLDSIRFIDVGTRMAGTDLGLVRYYSKGGFTTIANGTTSIIVNHLLSETPFPQNIMVTPMTTLNNASEFWVDTVTATQFTIHVDIDPGQNVNFSWRARTKF